MQALDADKCMVKVVSLAGLSCEGLASETMVKAQDGWLSQRLLWSRACLYEHSWGVGQDHVCAIIADSLMMKCVVAFWYTP